MSKAQRELVIARSALAEGDPKHAAIHAAQAIILNPLDPVALGLIDRLVEMPAPGLGATLWRWLSKEPVAPLFPDDGFAGNLAARCRAHWRAAHLDEAFTQAVRLAVGVHDQPFARWALDIAQEARSRGATLDHRAIKTAYSEIITSTIGLLHLRPTERAFFEPWSDLLTLLADPRQGGDEMMGVIASAFHRRAGRWEAALEAVPADTTEVMALTARGLALRGLGRWADAEATFARAEALDGDVDPDEFAYSHEIGRVRWDAGDYDGAAAAFAVGPELDFERRAVRDFVAEHSYEAGAAKPWSRLLGDRPSYDRVRRLALELGMVETMQDAGSNGLSSLGDAPPPLEISLALNCLESPSVLMTIALRIRGRPDPQGRSYSYRDVPEPHPFDVLDEHAGARLWARRGPLVTPAVDPPPADVTARIDDLVRQLGARFEKEGVPQMATLRAWTLAAAQPDVDQLEPGDLMAAMVHPSPPPRWIDVVSWVFHRQVVAAMLLGAQDGQRPWLASRRRSSLAGLLLGHPDWTRAAALYSLREVLLDVPEALDDAGQWCERLIDTWPSIGHVPWAAALVAVCNVPGMPAGLVERLRPRTEPPDKGS